MKGQANPFVISGYEGAKYFCDRVEETTRMASEIANGNNIALIATRRMGKSGLIEHYFSQAEVQARYYTRLISGLVRLMNRRLAWTRFSGIYSVCDLFLDY